MRWLHRYADARLREENERLTYARDQARGVARRLHRKLVAQRAATDTQAALTARWRSIAHQRAQGNEALRAQQKEQAK